MIIPYIIKQNQKYMYKFGFRSTSLSIDTHFQLCQEHTTSSLMPPDTLELGALCPPKRRSLLYAPCMTCCPSTSCRSFTPSFKQSCSASLMAAPGRIACQSVGHRSPPGAPWHMVTLCHDFCLFYLFGTYTHRSRKKSSALSFRINK